MTEEKKSKEKKEKAKAKKNKEKKSVVSSLLRKKETVKETKKKEPAPKALPKEEKTIEDPFSIIRMVSMTEKSIQLIESQNKLVFIVVRKSSKEEIKNSIEEAFQTKVSEIRTLIDQKGRKKAFIKLKEPGAAGDIAIRLGII